MSQEVSLVEIGGALVWAASCVAVAGYTWSAMTGEYVQFPSIDGGGGGSAVPPAVQQADTAIGLPKLPHGKKAGPFSAGQTQIAGVAASPITPNTVLPGSQGIINQGASWLSKGLNAIGNFLPKVLP